MTGDFTCTPAPTFQENLFCSAQFSSLPLLSTLCVQYKRQYSGIVHQKNIYTYIHDQPKGSALSNVQLKDTVHCDFVVNSTTC
jgi:hypothetical protein